MKKYTILLVSLLLLHPSAFALSESGKAKIEEIFDRFQQRTFSQYSDEQKIEKLQKIMEKANIIIDSNEYWPIGKLEIFAHLNNLACQANDKLGGPECAHRFIQPAADEEIETDGLRVKTLQVINNARKDDNQGLVNIDNRLNKVAQDYAQVLCEAEHISHTGPDGSTLTDRMEGSNYEYWVVGENLGRGQNKPETLIEQFLLSPGHRANLLHEMYEDIGIGYCNKYWVIVFGKEREEQ